MTPKRIAPCAILATAFGFVGAPARAELGGMAPALTIGIGIPIIIGAAGIASTLAHFVELQQGRPISKAGRGVGYMLGGLNLSVGLVETAVVADGHELFGSYLAVASVIHLVLGSIDLGVTYWSSENAGGAVPSGALAWFLAPSAIVGVVSSIVNGIRRGTDGSLSKGQTLLGYSIGFLNTIAGSFLTVLGGLDSEGRQAPFVAFGLGQVAVGVTNLIWAWNRVRGASRRDPVLSFGPLPSMNETGIRRAPMGLTLSVSRLVQARHRTESYNRLSSVE